MNACLKTFLIGVAVASGAAVAVAQDGIPSIPIQPGGTERFTFEIARNITEYGEGNLWLGEFAPFAAFDPDVDIAREFDFMTITFYVSDPDWTLEEDGSVGEIEDVFEYIAAWWVASSPGSPEASPLDLATGLFLKLGEGAVVSNGRIYQPVSLTFQISPYLGRNQDALRGDTVTVDGYWDLAVCVSNSEEPDFRFGDAFVDEGTDEVRCYAVPLIGVTKHPSNRPANPAPIADAGGDRTNVAQGSSVILNASRTFDGTNVGFDPDNPNVFEKDVLTYVWEWVSGPEYVEPRQFDTTSPFATVVLNTSSEVEDPDNPGEIDIVPYVFRVTASDDENDTTTSDYVEITVVDVADNLAPQARAARIAPDPADDIVVGDLVTLSAAASSDGDNPPDPLTYRWRQTDELGNSLTPADADEILQPVAGLTGEELSWQANAVGTYHFQLTVSDGVSSDATSISVTVNEAGSQTASTASSASDPDEAAFETAPAGGTGLCGGGVLLTLAIVPCGVWLLRRR